MYKLFCVIVMCKLLQLTPGGAFQGYTPLYLASRFGHLEVVKYLLSHGARVTIKCNKIHSAVTCL